LFKKQHNNKEVKLETSREIDQRIEAPKSTSHSQLQSDLVKLLTVSEGRRDQKWIQDFCNLRDQCVKLDIWESFNTKYNLHRGFTAQYV
tara:strand:- start:402 stop:668 length:267 start_codon:yes stop_codon:yes gene_type:complete